MLVVGAVHHSDAPGPHPVADYGWAFVGRKACHNAVCHIKGCHLHKWNRIRPGNPHAVDPFIFYTVVRENLVDPLLGAWNQHNPYAGLPQLDHIPYKKWKLRIVYDVAVNLDDKALALELMQIVEHLADSLHLELSLV